MKEDNLHKFDLGTPNFWMVWGKVLVTTFALVISIALAFGFGLGCFTFIYIFLFLLGWFLRFALVLYNFSFYLFRLLYVDNLFVALALVGFVQWQFFHDLGFFFYFSSFGRFLLLLLLLLFLSFLLTDVF